MNEFILIRLDLDVADVDAYAEQEEGQLGEIQAGIACLDFGECLEHDQVANWLRSWGTAHERKAPE